MSLDYLDVGAEVRIRTTLDKEFVGEVVCCEGQCRLLLLKSHRDGQQENCDDLHFINMDQVANVEVLKEADDVLNGKNAQKEPELSYIDISKLEENLKYRTAELARVRTAQAPQQGAPVAQVSSPNPAQAANNPTSNQTQPTGGSGGRKNK